MYSIFSGPIWRRWAMRKIRMKRRVMCMKSWCSCCNCCTRRRVNDEKTPLLSSNNTFEENKTQDKRKATVHSNCEDNLKLNEETYMGTEKHQNDNSNMANIVASDISIEKDDVKGNSRPSKSSSQQDMHFSSRPWPWSAPSPMVSYPLFRATRQQHTGHTSIFLLRLLLKSVSLLGFSSWWFVQQQATQLFSWHRSVV